MESRQQLQLLCSRYKALGRTNIDCRAASALLRAELVRIGHYKRKKPVVPVVIPLPSVRNSEKRPVVPLHTPSYLLYTVYPRLPVTVLLRLQNRQLLNDHCSGAND